MEVSELIDHYPTLYHVAEADSAQFVGVVATFGLTDPHVLLERTQITEGAQNGDRR